MVDLIEFTIVGSRCGYVRWAMDRSVDVNWCEIYEWVLWVGPRNQFVI